MNDQIKKSQELLSTGADKINKSHEAIKTIKVQIAKNFGKSITIELPGGQKHLITSSQNHGLYSDLALELKKGYEITRQLNDFDSTLLLPDDFDFGNESIPLENREA